MFWISIITLIFAAIGCFPVIKMGYDYYKIRPERKIYAEIAINFSNKSEKSNIVGLFQNSQNIREKKVLYIAKKQSMSINNIVDHPMYIHHVKLSKEEWIQISIEILNGQHDNIILGRVTI